MAVIDPPTHPVTLSNGPTHPPQRDVIIMKQNIMSNRIANQYLIHKVQI